MNDPKSVTFRVWDRAVVYTVFTINVYFLSEKPFNVPCTLYTILYCAGTFCHKDILILIYIYFSYQSLYSVSKLSVDLQRKCHIQETLNHSTFSDSSTKTKKSLREKVSRLSPFMCSESPVIIHMSPVTCYLSLSPYHHSIQLHLL